MLDFTAPCLFGLEGIVGDELRAMNAQNVRVFDGRVMFSGDYNTMAMANIRLRCAERVLINIGSFNATTFDELFECTKALPWEEFIRKDDAFPVKGHSLKSKLFSIPDCQSIIKKAIVERLKSKYGCSWFNETGAKKQIQFSIMKDNVVLMIDTTGTGLHKRGYRPNANVAPMRETLAAAIISLSRLNKGEILIDPFCGSGTLPIEAALYATRTAPGLNRQFAAESFKEINKSIWQQERRDAADLIRKADNDIYAFDIDEKCIGLTMENARRAGVSQYIKAKQGDVRNLKNAFDKTGVIVCNPPYGERLLEQKEAERLYIDMGKVFRDFGGFRTFVLTSFEDFPKLYGKKEFKNRKLYNGMIKCYLFNFR
ncbi:MAG: class I SAM-dependent RNA methyltransferase [Ruminococcaceae bacterium]|nr:class I SAM-dependent RNA methyltransferase [Oscillospiraceae bacterium]